MSSVTTRQDLTQKVIEIIACNQQIAPEAITARSAFKDLGIDSLGGLSIVSDIENEFHITVPDEEALNIHTVGDLIDGLSRMLSIPGDPSPESGITA
jgi:acyl carrier protein